MIALIQQLRMGDACETHQNTDIETLKAIAEEIQRGVGLMPDRETDEAKLAAMIEKHQPNGMNQSPASQWQQATGVHDNQLSGISEMHADKSSVQPEPSSVERNALFSSQIRNLSNSPNGISDPVLDTPPNKRSSDSSESLPVKRTRM